MFVMLWAQPRDVNQARKGMSGCNPPVHGHFFNGDNERDRAEAIPSPSAIRHPPCSAANLPSQEFLDFQVLVPHAWSFGVPKQPKHQLQNHNGATHLEVYPHALYQTGIFQMWQNRVGVARHQICPLISPAARWNTHSKEHSCFERPYEFLLLSQ